MKTEITALEAEFAAKRLEDRLRFGTVWRRRQICEYAFMRLTVDLPDALFKKVKSEAARRGMRLREFIAQALERSFAEDRDKLKSRRVRLPLVRGNGGPPINLTREQVDTEVWE